MPDPTTPRDGRFGEWMREMERRISALERSARLPFSSTKGGAFEFLDDANTDRFALGNVDFAATVDTTPLAGGYGTFIFDEHGAMVLGQQDGHRGLLYPSIPFPMHDSAAKTTNSATFISLYEGRDQGPVSDVLKVSGAVQTDADTTAQIRLNTGTSATSVLSLPAGTNGAYAFEWLHPSTTGIGDPRSGREDHLFVFLEARVTGGTGIVRVFPPQVAEIVSSWRIPTASTTGNPRLL